MTGTRPAPAVLTSTNNPNNLSEVRREEVVYSLFCCLLTVASLPRPAFAAPACTTPIDDDYYEALFSPPAATRSPAQPPPASGSAAAVPCEDPAQTVCAQAGELSDTAAHIPTDDPTLVPAACIQAIMERRPKASSQYLYAKCESESAAAGTETTHCVPAPRITDAYLDFTRRAFVGAFECLGEDPREFVGLIGNEASFQSNLGNTSHAWGVGQITPQAGAPELYGKRFAPYRDKPECAPYLDAMSLDGIKKSTPCLLTTPPMGPARNFIFAGLLFKVMRSEATALVPKGLSAADRKRMVRELTMEMYNGGDSAVASSWHNYLADQPGGASSYESFRTGFTAYLADHYGDGLPYFEKNTVAREQERRDVSHYVASVSSTTALANSKSKGCAR